MKHDDGGCDEMQRAHCRQFFSLRGKSLALPACWKFVTDYIMLDLEGGFIPYCRRNCHWTVIVTYSQYNTTHIESSPGDDVIGFQLKSAKEKK